jgi:hypothetical protein
MGQIGFAPAGALAKVNPIGRSVADAPESPRINEGLQQINGMPVKLLPIRRHNRSDPRQQMAR